jgi:hypothetical protein
LTALIQFLQQFFLEPRWVIAAPFLLGLLVVLYFLKLKRRQIEVSSTYLWKKALEDLRVNSPFQRLRMNLLLLLQLLVLAAILAALSRPVANLSGLTERNYVILIDRSASMQAVDGGGGRTRLAAALDEARRIVDGLQSWKVTNVLNNDRAVLVAFDEQAEILTPITEQKTLLREALGKIEATDRRTNLHSALDVTRGILQNLKQPVLTIISDGKVGDTKDLAVPEKVEVHYVKVGETPDNMGVASIEVRRAFEGGEASRVFATIYNSSEAKRTTGVDCLLGDDLIASKEVEVGPHEQASVAFESPKLRTGLLRVQIDAPDGAKDALPVDDVAYAVLREKKDVRVLLVTEGNPFLERGLEQDPLVRKDADGHVPKLAPGSFLPEDQGLQAFDLIVLDRVELKALGPGNYLIVDAIPPFEGIRAKGIAHKPAVVDWDEGHPVSRFVTFGSLDVTEARRVELRKEDRVVVSASPADSATKKAPKKRKPGETGPPEEDSAAVPLIFETRDGDRHCLVLSFDLMKTQSWPLKAAYPIFLANVVRWLGGAGREERALAVRTGEVAEIPVPKGATQAVVTNPKAQVKTIALKPSDEVLRFADTAFAGFYGVAFNAPSDSKEPQRVHFAANLASAEESDMGPAASIELTNDRDKDVKAEGKAEEARRELWKIFVLVAFGVLMLEWWVYNRRVYV